MAREGKLELSTPEVDVEFAAMVVAPLASEKEAAASGTAEIIMGAVTIRLKTGALAEPISTILRALATPA